MSEEIISLPIPIEKTPVESRFRLVILASERARSLMTVFRPVIPTSYKKATTIALHEILTARVEFLTGKEARKELRKAKTTQILEEARTLAEKAKEEEVKSEIEKDLTVYLPEGETREKPAGEE